MLLIFDKNTNQPLKYFQSNATEDGLLQNALEAGYEKEDLEVRNVEPEEFKSLQEQVFASDIAAAKIEISQMQSDALTLQKRLGLSADDLKLLNYLLANNQ